VSRVEPDGIVLKSQSGISKVYFTELPKEVQERFHYNLEGAATLMRQTELALRNGQFGQGAAQYFIISSLACSGVLICTFSTNTLPFGIGLSDPICAARQPSRAKQNRAEKLSSLSRASVQPWRIGNLDRRRSFEAPRDRVTYIIDNLLPYL
jgi:hypothetical protein